MSAFRAIATGRVQLVMYRDFIQRKASSLRIVGSVQNLKDGSVEIRAEGNREALEKLLEFARNGPILAEVEDVLVEWREPANEFTGFTITYT